MPMVMIMMGRFLVDIILEMTQCGQLHDANDEVIMGRVLVDIILEGAQ